MQRLLFTLGLRRGVLGNSGFWTVMFLFAGGMRVAKWLAGRESQTVYTAELPPGAALAISHLREDRRGKVPKRLR